MAVKCPGVANQEHIEETKPEVRSSIDRMDDFIDNVVGKSRDFMSSVKSKITKDTNEGFKNQVNTENIATKKFEENVNKKQTTTDEVSHKGLLRSIVDNIKNQFRAFKNLKDYRVQYALITNKESQAMARDAITKRLTFMYKGVSTSDLQNMVNLVLSGSMVDNYLDGMDMPMQNTWVESMKNDPDVDWELELEKMKTDPSIKEFIKREQERVKNFKEHNKQNKQNEKVIRKEIEELRKTRSEINDKMKADNLTEAEKNALASNKKSVQNSIDNKRGQLSFSEQNTKDNNSEIRKIENNLKSEEHMSKVYVKEMYLNSIKETREHYFGKEYVRREMEGDESLTLDDVDENSELAKNEKLMKLMKDRKKMFLDIKNNFIKRAHEVLNSKHASDIEMSLERFERYYKNIVHDVEVAIKNSLEGKTGANFFEGMINNRVGQYIQRMGTKKDIDNNILYIDTIALGQLYQQTIQLDMIETIQEYDMNKDIIKEYQNSFKTSLNDLVKRIENDNLEERDKKVYKRIKGVVKKVKFVLENNQDIDPQLKDVLENISEDNFTGKINGQDMNVLEQIDFVFENLSKYVDTKFRNELDMNVLTNFYHTNPQFKETIEYLLDQTQKEPTASQFKHFLEMYSSTRYKGSASANDLLTVLNQKNNFKKSIEQSFDKSFKDFMPEDALKTHMITTSNGNPLSYYTGDKKINQINISGLLDIEYGNPGAVAKGVYDQLMVSMDADYLDVLFKNQDIMIIPNEIGNALMESLTPPKDLNPVSRTFNRWLRPLMILSPERIIKFNLNTALMSDIYRVSQTNPKIFRNVKSSIEMIMEYAKTGEVKNFVEPGNSVYNNRQKLFYEFKKLFGGQFEREMDLINQKISGKQWTKLQNKMDTINKSNNSEKNKAKKLIKAYLDIVGPITNYREMTLRLSYAMETAREIDEGKEIHYGASKKKSVNEFLDRGEHFKFASAVSNQNFIAYKEAGRMARFLNRQYMPFFLFPEGNVKWHYRLYQNYISEIFDKNISYQRRASNVGKMGVSLAIQLGIAQAIWNLASRAIMGGPDEEEIPEYLKGKDVPFIGDFLQEAGVPMDNYLQFGPVIANKFNLAQDVFSFIPEVGEEEWASNYAKQIFGRVSPLAKAPIEVISGGDYYADGNMYPVSDKYNLQENVARKVGSLLGGTKTFDYWFDYFNDYPDEYKSSDDNLMTGIVGYGQMMFEYQGNAVTQNNLNAHQQMKSLYYDYLDELGKPYNPSPGYGSDKDQIKNAIKQGIKYGDQVYLDKMIAEYIDYLAKEEDKTSSEIKRDIIALFKGQSLRHMGSANNKERINFIRNLSVSEYEMFKKAMAYEKTMFGKYYSFVL